MKYFKYIFLTLVILLSTKLFSQTALPASGTNITTSTGSWLVPANVYSIKVESWGGGGAGAGRSTTGTGGLAGGAGGSRSTTNISVTPGQIIYFNIGATRAGTTGNATNGNDTWVNKTSNSAPTLSTDGTLAKGGQSAVGTTAGVGSITGCIGTSNKGGSGRLGGTTSGGGGSSAGNLLDGNTATSSTGATAPAGGGNGGAGHATGGNGTAGSVPGGGGGGSFKNNTTARTGGSGAAGRVILTYTPIPNCATLISPTNNQVDVVTSQTLSWNAVSGATSYDVYFGTGSTPSFIVNQSSTTYNPGTLNNTTQYYWKIVAKNAAGDALSCSTWNFTTKSPGCLTNTYGQYPTSTYNPGCSGTAENITTVGYASEYSMVSLISGVTYTLSSSITTDYITISDDLGTSVLAYATGSISYTCPSDGDYRFYTHTNQNCGSSTTSRSRRIQCSTPPPPANDLIANAQDVGVCGGTFNGNTKFSTNGDGPSCYTASGETWTAPGVWYTVIGNGQTIIASLCGSNFDTKIFIYTGTPGILTCLTANDDFCSTQSEVSFASTLNTTYYILVTGYGSARGSFGLSVSLSPSPPVITTQPVSGSVCPGQTKTFSVVSNGNQGPLTYQWYLGGVLISGANQSSYTASTVGTYYVIVSNSCGSTTQSSNTTLSFYTVPTILVNSPDICNGFSTQLNASGAISYLWNNSLTTYSISVNPTTTTNYTVTGTSSNGCQSQAVSTVNVNPNPQVLLSSTSSTICSGGSGTNNITASVSSGSPTYSYQWSYYNGTSWVNTGTNSNVINATPTSTRDYKVTITDIKGCQVVSAVHTVSVVPDPISPTLNTKTPNENDVCSGTNVSATFNSGSDGVGCSDVFQYSTNGTTWITYTPGTNISTTGFAQGTTVQIRGRRSNCTSGIGCAATTYVVLSQWNVITKPILSTSVNDITCSGGGNGSINLTVSGSLGPFSFNWTGPNGFTSTSEDITNLTTGTYTVVVSTYVGCSSTATVSVTEPSSLVLTIVGSNALCTGQSSGSIDLTVSGGTPSYTYLWSNGSTNEDLTNLSPGNYIISVTDNSSCVATSSVTISNPTPFTISVNSPTISTCQNLPVQLTVTNGNTYLWSNGSTTSTISVLPTSTTVYTVESWNENNCYAVAQSTVTVDQTPPLLTIGNVSGPNQVYNYMVNGTIATYSVAPVVGATNYTWYIPNDGVFFTSSSSSNVITVQITPNFVGGEFYVMVNNSCGSSYSDTLTVDILQDPIIVGSSCGTPLGSQITHYISNSLPGLTYVWTPPYGSTIVTGQGNDTMKIKYSYTWFNSTTPSNLVAKVITQYGTFTGSKAIIRNPSSPLSINGPTVVCADNSTIYEYYVDSVSNATGYIWGLPATVILVDGQLNDTIHVKFNTTYLNGNFNAQSLNQCASSAMTYGYAQNINVPLTPGTISGPTDVCPFIGSTATFSVVNQVGYTYYWTAPSGVNIVSGQGTNVVQLSVPVGFTSGMINVKMNNGCGYSNISTFNMTTVQQSIVVSPISGLTNPCTIVGTNQTTPYSITPLVGVTYNWLVPVNMQIVSGQGTNSIQAKFLSGFSGGTASLVVTPNCGNPATTTKNISPVYPAMNLIGTTCIENGQSYNYYINLSNVSSYNIQSWNWVVPTGAVITSGQGTSSIMVSYPANFESNCLNNLCDSLKCFIQFPCGTKMMAKRIGMTTYPVATITGPISTCGPDTIQLSASSSNRATIYYWGNVNGTTFISINGIPTIPSQSQTVNSKINTTFLGSNYNVQAINQCGSTAMRYFYVAKDCTTPFIINSTTETSQSIVTIDDIMTSSEYIESNSKPLDFITFPNPGKDVINLRVFKGSSDYYLVKINNLFGEIVYSSLHESNDVLNVSKLNEGIFFITIESKEGYKLTKEMIIKK
jgi:hypothetical protein